MAGFTETGFTSTGFVTTDPPALGPGQTVPFGNVSAEENMNLGNVKAEANTCNFGEVKG